MTGLYSGHNDQYADGIGITLSKEATQALIGWKPVNELIITARLCTRLAEVTVIQVYAPTETAADDEKDPFYNQLQDILQEAPSFDIKVVLLGDFSAKLDANRRNVHHGWPSRPSK